MRKLLLIISFLGACFSGKAQDFSNRGKDFWLCYPAHIDANSSRMALYISSTVNTSGTVYLQGGSIPFTVTANQATVVQISPNIYPVINTQNEGVGVGKGIHVTSLSPVVVYSHILNAARSGSTLILPTNTLGKEYIASSFRSSTNSNPPVNGVAPGSQFSIVAVEDNTTVEIIPTATDVSGTKGVNTPFTVTLNKGDVYQYRTTYNNDISGTKISSISAPGAPCKPIAVFSGSSWTTMDCANASGGDNLYLELMPKSAWGKNYITAPFAGREYDVFRIYVDNPNTQVTRNGGVLPVSSLINNSYYQFSSFVPNIISSDNPIMVVQYMISQTCDSRNSPPNIRYPGDPEMIIINPIEQTLNDVTVVSARANLTPPSTNITAHYFTIIMKTDATPSLRIDGVVPNSTFIPIFGTDYSFIQEDVTISTNTNPSHRIKADSGFIALAYGVGNVESYGYNAGMNIKDLYQFITIQNDYGTVNFPAGCKNSPFKFSMTLPYNPISLHWIFGASLNAQGINDTLINNPIPDSTWVLDGKLLYQFKLNKSYLIPNSGIYPIKLIANNPTPDGCGGIQEIEYDLQIFDPPIADFNFTHTGCVSDSVAFFDNTNGQGRPVIKWYWDYGDASTGTITNPKHKYLVAGTKTVRHATITDVGCLSDTVSKVIPISDPPIAGFTVLAPYCEKTAITFKDASTVPVGVIVKWEWNLGDGTLVNNITGADVQHTYATAGTYTVTLTVETGTGCRSVLFSKPIVIHAKPIVDFSLPGNVCLPIAAKFTDLTTIAEANQVLTYLWDFGDGITSTDKDPVHNYTSTGPFTTKLIVTSNNGCVDDSVKLVSTVYPKAKADFTVSAEVCLNDSTRYTDASDPKGSAISQWNWTFGDGTNATVQNPVHRFLLPNTFVTALYIVTDKGCYSDTITKSTVVNPLPTANFSIVAPTCETKNISFTDASNPNVGTLTKWNWDFGTGSTSTGQNPIVTYPTAGTYTVTLGVENSKGCLSAITSKPITVNSQPVPAFGTPEVCLSDPFALFTDSSTIADNSQNQFTYQWTFGDPNATGANPNTSTLKNPQHRYIAVGNYNIGLTVTSKDGCVSSLTKPFTVNGSIPQAAYTVNNATSLCSNQEVSIKDASTVDFGSVVKVEVYWDYNNDPTIKTLDDDPLPGKLYTHKYPDFGTPGTKTYRVRYVAYSGINCINEITKTITVNASPLIQFDAMNNVCQEVNPFQILSAREIYGFAGNGAFSGPGILSTTGTFSPAIAKPGTHTIRYSFTAANGCSTFADQTITVDPTPGVDAGPDRTVLEGGFIVIQGKGTGTNLSYLWTPNTAIENNKLATPKVSPVDDITYTLTVTSGAGCVASDQVFVKVLKKPKVPNAFSPNGDGINDNWVIEYLDSYQGATVEVFNRYGQLVYHSIGYTKPWDGTFNGNPLPVATYYWIINPKNGRQQMNGSVTIIR